MFCGKGGKNASQSAQYIIVPGPETIGQVRFHELNSDGDRTKAVWLAVTAMTAIYSRGSDRTNSAYGIADHH